MSPFLSIVVVSYDMARELQRTLYTLSAEYQRGIGREEYEVILVDNGSNDPPRPEQFAHLDLDLSVYSMPSPTHSPVGAINFGINKACGGAIGVCIDGARMLSPGMLAAARDLLSVHRRGIVGTRGCLLGHKIQREAMLEGYDAAVEDELLRAVDWRRNGYLLFDISVFDETAGGNWFAFLAESNALFAPRAIWQELGGYDPKFTSRGGGLVNLDTWDRACRLPDTSLFVLVGEATFHQVHGGVATNGSTDVIRSFYDEYRDIRGRDYIIPDVPFSVYGRPVAYWISVEKTRTSGRVRIPIGRHLRGLAARVSSARLSPRSRRSLRRGVDVVSAVVSRHPLRRWHELRAEDDLADGIEISGLFDPEWYVRKYPDVVRAGYRPAVHYVRYGATQSRSPSPLFDGPWYLQTYDDVRDLGFNPLLHYIQHGRYEGRRYRAVLNPWGRNSTS